MRRSRSELKIGHAPAWCREVKDPSADRLCALADWRRRAFRVELAGGKIHPRRFLQKTENRRVLRNSPSRARSVFGYDRSERCFLSCTSGTVQTEPAHCGVTSPGASAPNLVNTRMPKKLGRGPRARRVSRFSSNQKTSKTQFMAHTRLLPAARAQIIATLEVKNIETSG